MKKIFLISFTDNGQALAEKLACGLNQKEMEVQAFRCGNTLSLSAFASQGFRKADALIFVGAMGIAVRAIAPHVVSKVKDPAVVVIDDKGNNTISVLSGHLGGGNELTHRSKSCNNDGYRCSGCFCYRPLDKEEQLQDFEA